MTPFLSFLSSAHFKLDSVHPFTTISLCPAPWPPCCQMQWTSPYSLTAVTMVNLALPFRTLSLLLGCHTILALLALPECVLLASYAGFSLPSTFHVVEPRIQALVLPLHHPYLLLGNLHNVYKPTAAGSCISIPCSVLSLSSRLVSPT